MRVFFWDILCQYCTVVGFPLRSPVGHLDFFLCVFSNPGQSVRLSGISVPGFLPEGARGFFAYPGSTTEPGCSETVDWVVMNRPVYVTVKQVGRFFFSFIACSRRDF